MTIQELEAHLLGLEIGERARLAEVLLQSLEGLTQAENERLWEEEELRRKEEIEMGKVALRPMEDVMRDIRARLG